MQWRPCRRHSCWNSGLLLWKIRAGNTCGPTFHNHFCLMWQFLRLQVQWSHDNTSFSSKKYRRAPCHQPDPVRLLLRAPGSATPTPTVHAFFRCTRWLSTFHRGARPVFTRPSLSERTRSILQTSFFFERKNESERARERASMTGESSRARFGWPHFFAECNLPSQSSAELEQKS